MALEKLFSYYRQITENTIRRLQHVDVGRDGHGRETGTKQRVHVTHFSFKMET